MSVSTTGATGIDALAQQLLRTFDVNKDGKLSANEFSAVLSSMINARPNGTSTADTSSVEAPATARNTSQLAGFDMAKFATSQSPKYKFARAAADFDLGSVNSKPAAEALLNQMRPAFQREGLDVHEIRGDRIRITHEGQDIWIDVIQAAGVGATAFQWLPD